MIQSAGKLIYNPRSHLGSNDKWLVLMCDDEISKYYRHLYTMKYSFLNGERTGKLTRPIWGAHISIIRGEKLPSPGLWRLDEGKIVNFEYEPGVIDNKIYYWLKVKCHYLNDLRERYSLPREPRFGLHLTIGRK
jgi:hypothetical protein